MHPNLFARRRGSALILVLWCLLLLGMAVFSVIDMVELSSEHTSHEELAMEARALALSGLALGSHPQVRKDDPLLAQQPSDSCQFKVTIQSEGTRLNLNYILLTNHREILENLFTHWGLQLEDAEHVADCLYDWVTPGDLRSLNGAKAKDYLQAGLKQVPTYQPFRTLDEVGLVMDIDLLDKVKPNWRDSFTLWSSGPLYIKEAPAELIAAVFGLEPERVEYFTKTRDGKDGIPGTDDDVAVPDLKTLQFQLGLSDYTVKKLGNQVSFGDPIRRVESVGQVEGTQVMISVVTRLNTSPVQYLLWSEQ